MAGWRATLGKPRGSRAALLLGVAGAIAWAAVVALNPAARSGPRGGETTPPASFEASGSLATGPFVLWQRPAVSAEIRVTIPSAGWFGTPGDGILFKNDDPKNPDGAGVIVFAGTAGSSLGMGDAYLYADPCRWSTSRPPAPAATAEEAVAGLAKQLSSEPSTPVDVFVGGHPGKAITLRVPDDLNLERCDQGEFRMFLDGPDNPRDGYVPGQIDELWIVNAGDAERLVIFDLTYDDQNPLWLVDELRSIVESATFK